MPRLQDTQHRAAAAGSQQAPGPWEQLLQQPAPWGPPASGEPPLLSQEAQYDGLPAAAVQQQQQCASWTYFEVLDAR